MQSFDQLNRQQVVDAEHLKMLRIGYIVTGILSCLFALFPLIYVVIGVILAIVGATADSGADAPPAAVGVLVAIVGFIVSMIIATSGILKLQAAKAIRQRRKKNLIYVAAALACLDVPVGTITGVCTFMVLGRPTVQQLFAEPGPMSAMTPPPHYESMFNPQNQYDPNRR